LVVEPPHPPVEKPQEDIAEDRPLLNLNDGHNSYNHKIYSPSEEEEEEEEDGITMHLPPDYLHPNESMVHTSNGTQEEEDGYLLARSSTCQCYALFASGQRQ
jgi:hypothetical protein